jgi:hypothetical protein
MKVYEEKLVTKKEKVLTKITCDQCEKEIKKNEEYYYVATHHMDWGNDSIDSYEYKDICSDECLRKEVEDYIGDPSSTKEIEIERTTNT